MSGNGCWCKGEEVISVWIVLNTLLGSANEQMRGPLSVLWDCLPTSNQITVPCICTLNFTHMGGSIENQWENLCGKFNMPVSVCIIDASAIKIIFF